MNYFIVITKVPDDGDGNCASEEMIVNPSGADVVVGSNLVVGIHPPDFESLFAAAIQRQHSPEPVTSIDLTTRKMVFCSTPVFSLGEILIMDSTNDRTIPDGRKPRKWNVEFEQFNDIESAVARSREVFDA